MGFSERLIELRKRRKMTQGDLAERVGVSRQSVSKWETGESFPDLPKLVQLADALKVSMDVLCARTEIKEGDVVVSTILAPKDTAKRSEVATMIMRFCQNILYW